METKTMKAVYTIVERSDKGLSKSYWSKVGVGFVNRDGSITLKLDALPVNGTLQIRDWEERDEREKRRASNGTASGADHGADALS